MLQLPLFQSAPGWADRFPAIWARVERWGLQDLPPWTHLGDCRVAAVERRCNVFVFRLIRPGHRWQMVFREDGTPYASQAGWACEGNNADVELLPVPAPLMEVAA